jgi:hypothetical protein
VSKIICGYKFSWSPYSIHNVYGVYLASHWPPHENLLVHSVYMKSFSSSRTIPGEASSNTVHIKWYITTRRQLQCIRKHWTRDGASGWTAVKDSHKQCLHTMRLWDVDGFRSLPDRPCGQWTICVAAHELFSFMMPWDGLQRFCGLATRFCISRPQIP